MPATYWGSSVNTLGVPSAPSSFALLRLNPFHTSPQNDAFCAGDLSPGAAGSSVSGAG